MLVAPVVAVVIVVVVVVDDPVDGEVSLIPLVPPLVEGPSLVCDASSVVDPSVPPTGGASSKHAASIAAEQTTAPHRPNLRIQCTISRPFGQDSDFPRTRFFATDGYVGGLLPHMNTWLSRTTATTLALTFAALPAGCDDACTEIAVASVTLEVVAADDQTPIADATIEFTLDGGETRAPEYADQGVYTLATEEDGRFDVDISAEGFETVMRTYTMEMDADGCHVQGESETIQLARAEE